jgi:hypothetical protein
VGDITRNLDLDFSLLRAQFKPLLKELDAISRKPNGHIRRKTIFYLDELNTAIRELKEWPLAI